MKALVCTEFAPYGDHKVIEIDAPKMKPGHVRLKIHAAGVNFPDILMVQGQYQFKPPFPFIAGAECAGEITELGEGVKHLKVGQRVASLPGVGCFAEEAVVPAEICIPISDKMSYEEAAGFVMVYATSHHSLKDRSDLKPGETLLVLGAAGGVGLTAVELGKRMGATVIAAASTQEKLDICKEYGADHGILYDEEDLKARVRKITGGKGADICYDPVGDKYAEPALRSLAWGGRYLVIGFAAGQIPKVAFNWMLLKELDVRGIHWGAWIPKNPKGHMENMGELMTMYENGEIKPRVSGTHKLENFADAMLALTERRVKGKVVLTMR
ncbi:MAG: NADPH:quinone oxidoreductase family protein [Hyphomonadaceae bacterium]|nr:NADPH:quinone oxidoreductase family protein [Hyphomonadaceae bacterium]